MIKQLSLLAICLLVWLPRHVEATQFQYNHDMTCDHPVTADIVSMTCDGSETCHLGDEMKVYGSVTLEEDLPSSTLCMTVKSCFMGLKFLCKTHLEKVDVCETLGMSADNGATACPSAGSFYFDYLLQLPTDVDWLAMGSGACSDVDVNAFLHHALMNMTIIYLRFLNNRVVGHCLHDAHGLQRVQWVWFWLQDNIPSAP